jgi:uncharacterized FlaG/YvyC family protein
MNPFSVNAISVAQASSPAATQSTSPSAPPSAEQIKQQALNLAVSKATRVLNDVGYAGAGRQISFSLDPSTHQPVIEILDIETNKVLFQWPSAYVLELAAEQSKGRDE